MGKLQPSAPECVALSYAARAYAATRQGCTGVESKLRGREAKGKGGEKKQPHEHMGMLRTSTEEGIRHRRKNAVPKNKKRCPKHPILPHAYLVWSGKRGSNSRP